MEKTPATVSITGTQWKYPDRRSRGGVTRPGRTALQCPLCPVTLLERLEKGSPIYRGKNEMRTGIRSQNIQDFSHEGVLQRQALTFGGLKS
jgi:hypothetical protein